MSNDGYLLNVVMAIGYGQTDGPMILSKFKKFKVKINKCLSVEC